MSTSSTTAVNVLTNAVGLDSWLSKLFGDLQERKLEHTMNDAYFDEEKNPGVTLVEYQAELAANATIPRVYSKKHSKFYAFVMCRKDDRIFPGSEFENIRGLNLIKERCSAEIKTGIDKDTIFIASAIDKVKKSFDTAHTEEEHEAVLTDWFSFSLLPNEHIDAYVQRFLKIYDKMVACTTLSENPTFGIEILQKRAKTVLCNGLPDEIFGTQKFSLGELTETTATMAQFTAAVKKSAKYCNYHPEKPVESPKPVPPAPFPVVPERPVVDPSLAALTALNNHLMAMLTGGFPQQQNRGYVAPTPFRGNQVAPFAPYQNANRGKGGTRGTRGRGGSTRGG